MKKLFFIVAVALAALVSCNKDKEVTKDDNAAGDITKVCLNEVCGVVGITADFTVNKAEQGDIQHLV